MITFDFLNLNLELRTQLDKFMINWLAMVLVTNWCLLLLHHEYFSDQFLNQILFIKLPLYLFPLGQGNNDGYFIYFKVYYFIL